MRANIKIGNQYFTGDRPILLGGPCVIESEKLCFQVAEFMKKQAEAYDFLYVFKASFDKANRTSIQSFRSLGFEESLKILEKVSTEFDLPIVTDIHETIQVDEVASVADILQIPAFLSRQTDLLIKAAKSGKVVNIKKGQFLAPEDMEHAVKKVCDAGNKSVLLTERGSSFGYHNLVVDMRSLPVMRQYAPILFDVTHSVQRPGGLGGKSGGNREMAPYLARAAAAVGVDGFFIETHPRPDEALSDGPNMIPLREMPAFLEMIREIWTAGNKFAMLN